MAGRGPGAGGDRRMPDGTRTTGDAWGTRDVRRGVRGLGDASGPWATADGLGGPEMDADSRRRDLADASGPWAIAGGLGGPEREAGTRCRDLGDAAGPWATTDGLGGAEKGAGARRSRGFQPHDDGPARHARGPRGGEAPQEGVDAGPDTAAESRGGDRPVRPDRPDGDSLGARVRDEALVRIHDLAGRPRGLGFVADHRGTVVTGHEVVDGLPWLVLRAAGGTAAVWRPRPR